MHCGKCGSSAKRLFCATLFGGLIAVLALLPARGQQIHRNGDRQHARDRDVAAGEGDALGEIARHLSNNEPTALLMVAYTTGYPRRHTVNTG